MYTCFVTEVLFILYFMLIWVIHYKYNSIYTVLLVKLGYKNCTFKYMNNKWNSSISVILFGV